MWSSPRSKPFNEQLILFDSNRTNIHSADLISTTRPMKKTVQYLFGTTTLHKNVLRLLPDNCEHSEFSRGKKQVPEILTVSLPIWLCEGISNSSLSTIYDAHRQSHLVDASAQHVSRKGSERWIFVPWQMCGVALWRLACLYKYLCLVCVCLLMWYLNHKT